MARKVHIEPPAGDNLNTLQGAGVSVMPALMVDSSEYLSILHNAPTNELAALSNAPITQRDSFTRESVIESGSVRLFIEDYSELLAPRNSIFKLLDMCLIELARTNDYRSKKGAENKTVTISLDRYMELCGLDATNKPQKDKARRRVHEDLNYLYRFSLEWHAQGGGKYADFRKERICTIAELKKGIITFAFTDNLANSLNSAYIGQYPTAIFRLDDRNKNTYPLARKIAMHASNDYNRAKGTAYILSVESLLSVCPDIPSYKEIEAKSRAFTQKIREPLEKALDALQEFATWEYCNSKGAPLTEEQLAARDWHTFSKFLVRFKLIGEPDNTERLQRKAERQAKASNARRKRTPVKKSDSEK